MSHHRLYLCCMLIILVVFAFVYWYRKNRKPHLGFVMVRHVRDPTTSQYWFKSYQSIRKYYPDAPIVVIDDSSNPVYVDKDLENNLFRCRIIHSEFPKRGEILGYYYFWRHKWFQKAVIIHDSVFFHQWINFYSCKKVKFLWHIEDKQFDNVKQERCFLHDIGSQYVNLYDSKDYWKGCFGVMSVIDIDFLNEIANIFMLLPNIKTRSDRCCLERIFAVLCFYHYPSLMMDISVIGDIHEYSLPWGYEFKQYQQEESTRKFPPLVKVWTGR